MKACPHCRAEYEENLIYCTKDGSPLIDTEAPTADDIEIDTYLRKSEIPAVKPIDDFETQARDADEFAETVYETEGETEFEETYRETDGDEIADIYSGVEEDEDFEEDPDEIEDEPVGYQKPIESEDKRSYLGLVVGAFALFGILVLGAALVGGFLYYQSQNQIETVSTDANQETNSSSEFPIDDTNENASDQENSNAEEYDTDGDLLTDIDTTTGSSSDRDSGKDKTNDREPNIDKEKEKAPTPTKSLKNETTTKDSSKTSETPVERRRPDPSPDRRNTPAPQRTPRKTPTPKRNIPTRISGGVVNGKAVSLPVPAYPSAARSSRVSGSVRVQVVISKTGNVMSARAVGGHPLLRSAAVSAARRARFRPTMLSGQPVEVSGVIVYNFKP